MIHIMSVADLARAAMTAPVVSDDPIAVIQEEHHLRVPVVSSQRPTMGEHDRLAAALILVENRDSILRRERAHGQLSR
jgi:hypothetical protein